MNSALSRFGRPFILSILGFAMSGAAAPSGVSSPTPATIQVFCLNHDGSVCRLVSPTVGLTVTVKDGDANLQYYAPSQDGFVERANTKVRPDLEARVGSGAMSPNDANVIFAEILANPFVAYRLPPNAETLNQDVGFAPNIQLSPQDQIEILRAHIQMSLSVSAVTSRYLSDGLGLQVIEPARPVNTEDPNLISESQVLLATPTEAPLAAPGPAAESAASQSNQVAPPISAEAAAPPASETPIPQGSAPQAPEQQPNTDPQLPAPLPIPLKTNPPTERITQHQETRNDDAI